MRLDPHEQANLSREFKELLKSMQHEARLAIEHASEPGRLADAVRDLATASTLAGFAYGHALTLDRTGLNEVREHSNAKAIVDEAERVVANAVADLEGSED